MPDFIAVWLPLILGTFIKPADAPPAFEDRADRGMRLEALQFLERRQERVLVVEPDHHADRDLAIFQVIDEGAAISAPVERPADSVDDAAGMVLRLGHFPQFL